MCNSVVSYCGNIVYCWLFVARVACACVYHTAKVVCVSDRELEIAKNGKWFNDDLVPRPFRMHNIGTHIGYTGSVSRGGGLLLILGQDMALGTNEPSSSRRLLLLSCLYSAMGKTCNLRPNKSSSVGITVLCLEHTMLRPFGCCLATKI